MKKVVVEVEDHQLVEGTNDTYVSVPVRKDGRAFLKVYAVVDEVVPLPEVEYTESDAAHIEAAMEEPEDDDSK